MVHKVVKKVKLWGSCSIFVDKNGKIYLNAPNGDLYRARLSKLPNRFCLETRSGLRVEGKNDDTSIIKKIKEI